MYVSFLLASQQGSKIQTLYTCVHTSCVWNHVCLHHWYCVVLAPVLLHSAKCGYEKQIHCNSFRLPVAGTHSSCWPPGKLRYICWRKSWHRQWGYQQTWNMYKLCSRYWVLLTMEYELTGNSEDAQPPLCWCCHSASPWCGVPWQGLTGRMCKGVL